MFRITEYDASGQIITSTDVSDLGIAYAIQRALASRGGIALVTFTR